MKSHGFAVFALSLALLPAGVAAAPASDSGAAHQDRVPTTGTVDRDELEDALEMVKRRSM